MKVEEIRVLGAEEINKRLDEAYAKLFKLRLQSATKQLTNHREIPQAKRNISRLKTILREKELGIRQVQDYGG
ncbi:MAG: 50S ribosomal protein L29 [Dehalococcoidales bacterium]|nr:50S ribosomal protein L29 [Dehalococcoidales bacterium]